MDPTAADFEAIVLLLTTALGLSFIIERVLEAINGFMKRILLSEHSSFYVRTRISTPEIDALEARAVQTMLEEKAEQITAMQAQLASDNLSPEERAALATRIVHAKEAALRATKSLAKVVGSQLKAPDLSPSQKARLERQQAELEAQLAAGEVDTSKLEVEERFPATAVFVNPASSKDPDETIRVLWLQLIGVFTGVLICFLWHFGLFAPLLGVFTGPLFPLDYLLTGVLIGAGSEPVHFLITFLTGRKVTELRIETKEQVQAAEEVATEASVVTNGTVVSVSRSSLTTIDVPYHGGVNREGLENRHRRPANPDLVIYHHTAMHSDATFDDVVRVIDERGFSTGYNCVVLKDGSIHPFCRWDRYGCHAKGYNSRSLGIALNGNFETNPSVPGANVNGRYGLTRPTDAQLRSAAKVVALWSYLYEDIKPTFGEHILPHKTIAYRPKACPGSNFPYTAFEELVACIYTQWGKSSRVQHELALFKQKAYLYV